MREISLIIAGTLCAAAAAFAALGDVVASWPSPGSVPCAVARSNDALFVYCNDPQGPHIYRMTPDTGSVYGSFPALEGKNTRGLAYVWGDHLWQGKAYVFPYRIYDTDARTGSIYRSYSHAVPCYGIAPLAAGDGGAGTTALFTSNSLASTIYQLNLSGSVQRSFALLRQMFDIAYDWRSKLIWGGQNDPCIYGCTTAGSLAASFPVPAQMPYGYAYHGQYLYVTTHMTRRIWKIHCPIVNAGVAPSSMGKIKATYK
jgi:hypothetical protein